MPRRAGMGDVGASVATQGPLPRVSGAGRRGSCRACMQPVLSRKKGNPPPPMSPHWQFSTRRNFRKQPSSLLWKGSFRLILCC